VRRGLSIKFCWTLKVLESFCQIVTMGCVGQSCLGCCHAALVTATLLFSTAVVSTFWELRDLLVFGR
jgi:hypothetical protein